MAVCKEDQTLKNHQLLTRVAYQYYVQNKTQSEIAKSCDLSRSTISRLLTQARQEQIVKIQIAEADLQVMELETQIKNTYHLRNVIVVAPEAGFKSNDQKTILAHGAGLYVKQIIKANSRVGISWGATLSNMVKQLHQFKSTNATFIPLVGGPSAANVKYNVNTIVYDLAKKFVGKSKYVNEQAVQKSPYLKNKIMKTAYYQELVTDWQNLDLAIVGIGGPLITKTTSYWRDLLTPDDLTLLKEQQAIGDCCCTFFDKNGKILAPFLRKRTIAIPLEVLKQVPVRIAVAYSLTKVPSIKTALSMGLVNTLITDEETARNLID